MQYYFRGVIEKDSSGPVAEQVPQPIFARIVHSLFHSNFALLRSSRLDVEIARSRQLNSRASALSPGILVGQCSSGSIASWGRSEILATLSQRSAFYKLVASRSGWLLFVFLTRQSLSVQHIALAPLPGTALSHLQTRSGVSKSCCLTRLYVLGSTRPHVLPYDSTGRGTCQGGGRHYFGYHPSLVKELMS